MVKVFGTIEAFRDDNPARRDSVEADFGYDWRHGSLRPHFRVSYSQNTGDLYAIRLVGHPAGPVRLLGNVPVDDSYSGNWCRTINAILHGWEELTPAARTLRFFERRLARANAANGRPSLPPGGGGSDGDVYWLVPGKPHQAPQYLMWDGPGHAVHLHGPGERPGWFNGEDFGAVTEPFPALFMAQQAVAEWWADRQPATLGKG